MFSKRLEFYKCNFEIWFFRMTRFTRKLVWGCYAYFWIHFSRYTYYMMILMLVGAGCCTISGESINSVWLDCHRISWRIDADYPWRDRKLAQGYPSTLRRMREVILGLWETSVLLNFSIHIVIFWLYYFIIIFKKLCICITNCIGIFKI